jgi:hypothetical protein
LNTYEELQDEACKDGIEIIDNHSFKSDRISGLYCNNTIALSKNLKNSAEKACVLAEELGHHYTAAGNILDQSTATNRKQEMRGRIVAYNKLVGLRGIIDAYLHNCQNLFETADYLGVTEEFLNDSLTYYTNKYGVCTQVDNYVVFFQPNIGVMELI